MTLSTIIINKNQHSTFVSNKPLGNLLGISLTNFIPLETFDLAFPYIDVWFTDWNSQLLEIENRVNLTLVINWCRYYKNAFFNST